MTTPPEGVATPSAASQAAFCPECGAPLIESSRGHGGDKRLCSGKCRSAAFDRTHPRVPVRKRDKLTQLTQAQIILARLRQGPATALELLQAGGGMRAAARVYELRAEGHQIETDMPGDTGLEWPHYRLVDRD